MEELAKIVGKNIVIKIPIDILTKDYIVPSDLLVEEGYVPFTVMDKETFAQDFLNQLNMENGENGDTPIHKLLDDAFRRTIECSLAVAHHRKD